MNLWPWLNISRLLTCQEGRATRFEGPIYEYACHEGNLAMTGILAGARAQERAAKTR